MNVCVMSNSDYFDILSSTNESKINYLNTIFDNIMNEHTNNLNKINEKIINESGNNDDIKYLTEAEANETKKKSTGIITKILNTISAFFKHIKDFLFGKEEEIDENKLPENIELPANPEEVMKEADNTMSAISQFLSNKKGKLIGIVSGAAFAFGAYRCGKKHVKPLIKALKRYSETLIKRTDAINKQIENSNLDPEDISFLKKGINKIAEIKNTISDIIKAIPHMSDPAFKNIHEEEKNNANNSNDDKKSRSQKKVEKNASKAEATLEKAKKDLEEKKLLVTHYKNELEDLKKAKSVGEERLKSLKSSATKGDTFVETLKNKGNQYLYFHILGKDRDKVTSSDLKRLNKISTKYGNVFSTNKKTFSEVQKDVVKIKNDIEIVQRSILNAEDAVKNAEKEVSAAELNLTKINQYDKIKANS